MNKQTLGAHQQNGDRHCHCPVTAWLARSGILWHWSQVWLIHFQLGRAPQPECPQSSEQGAWAIGTPSRAPLPSTAHEEIRPGLWNGEWCRLKSPLQRALLGSRAEGSPHLCPSSGNEAGNKTHEWVPCPEGGPTVVRKTRERLPSSGRGP